MEKLKEILISDKVLDRLGFSEYHDNNGESGSRTLRFKATFDLKIKSSGEVYKNIRKAFSLQDIDAVEGESEQRFTTDDFCELLVTLHDIYERLDEDCKKEFVELVENKFKK